METLEKGLSIDPTSSELWVQKAWVHYPTDFEEFKKAYEHGLKLEPNNTENYVRLIEQCFWEDETDNAKKYYERLLFYNPAFSKSFDEIVEYIKL